MGVFWKYPNKGNFMDIMVEKCSDFNLKENQIYLLRGFNNNLSQNGNYILNGTRKATGFKSLLSKLQGS